jgi:multidrug efflux pump subunit AcrB
MIIAEEYNFMCACLVSHIRIYFCTVIAAAVSLLAAYIFWAMYPTNTKTYEDQADVIIEVAIPNSHELTRSKQAANQLTTNPSKVILDQETSDELTCFLS